VRRAHQAPSLTFERNQRIDERVRDFTLSRARILSQGSRKSVAKITRLMRVVRKGWVAPETIGRGQAVTSSSASTPDSS
jgi:hypothetical protein